MKRVALITGVAGGIGKATAKVFHNSGWQVVGVDRKPVGDLPKEMTIINADISDPESVKGIFKSIGAKEKKLNALINNAAVQICKPLVDTTPDEWDAVMTSNLRSVYLAVRQAYPLMKNQEAAIINVSSVHAIATSANISSYAASKGALLALTRALAIELAVDGIRVNAVLPGAVDTPMLHSGLNRGHLNGTNTFELMHSLGQRTVIGRVGRPEEIAQAILFLAENDCSSFITGHAMIVDGGATARLSTE